MTLTKLARSRYGGFTLHTPHYTHGIDSRSLQAWLSGSEAKLQSFGPCCWQAVLPSGSVVGIITRPVWS